MAIVLLTTLTLQMRTCECSFTLAVESFYKTMGFGVNVKSFGEKDSKVDGENVWYLSVSVFSALKFKKLTFLSTL